MVDIVITAASVIAASDASNTSGTAGETITAGQPVYKSPTTKKYMKADSNSGTAEARRAEGIALNGASLNQPLVVQRSGDITIGGTLVAGAAYFLSDTPGGICPLADVGTGEYICQLGLAKSASVLAINIQYPGVAL
ncbi:MAG: hypothetical protein H0W39_01030 [Sphingomonas sp.]|nr:hypothetical protein [Sphingomonas sp.]